MLMAGKAPLLWCLILLGQHDLVTLATATEEGRDIGDGLAAGAPQSSEGPDLGKVIAEKEAELERMAAHMRAMAGAGDSSALEDMKKTADAMDAGLVRARELQGEARLEVIESALEKRWDFVKGLNRKPEPSKGAGEL
uniref:Uncharacterized protein n=1 Tax=Alexandrium catenella TaxID=2925 RepID=A0A7S1SFW8_ALECA|mmetsp:Transcript_98888/g.262627  ORF Transcript_98888/g.262627 Transcript_98888/m.262627 type:complete len:138 (+) Transcript_98888:63-476(+)|eukprot:CAMPEP_0171208736 /NCGR_PEP_ID=MMETSP0790-20130122/28240_1 /TAXON_ID=2925 /ORGANISM="Alexandrium catenella, Strain OF101" /LENGTH=137 /DNA_ID=CAMNT_0011674337 /DNA_START=62 /DNA_END=475 /DNA_ORIENTATION=-